MSEKMEQRARRRQKSILTSKNAELCLFKDLILEVSSPVISTGTWFT
jgi:hypothetical protein